MNLEEKAEKYLEKLCVDIKERVVGSQGNRDSTLWFEDIVSDLGFKTETQSFNCIEWIDGGSTLSVNDKNFEVFTGPFSNPCDRYSELVIVETLDKLKNCNSSGKFLLIAGEIVEEQLMPKGFVFYNPDHHKEIYSILEKSEALAIVSATGKNPELAGSLYPFPFIEDGDFNIPNIYMKDVDGEELKKYIGETLHLEVISKRLDEKGFNVIATKGDVSKEKIILCAHIDSKPGTPGAIDNATGIIVLLLVAELLENYNKERGIEIVALNGEDYFSIPGQMEYLNRVQKDQSEIKLVVNIDGAGFKGEKGAYSFYECSEEITKRAQEILNSYPQLLEGPQWIQSDHGMFVQMGIPSMAFTSNNFMEKLSVEITHTENDKPSVVDCSIVADIAKAISEFINKL